MTDKEKKIVFSIVGVMVLILVIVLCVKLFGKPNTPVNNTTGNTATTNQTQNDEKYVTNLEDGTKLNNSADLKKTKTYNNLEISNIQFTSKNGSSVILADVKNIGTTTHEEEIVKLTLLGENNEVLNVLYPSIGKVEAGQTIKLNAGATANIANAKDFKIEKK